MDLLVRVSYRPPWQLGQLNTGGESWPTADETRATESGRTSGASGGHATSSRVRCAMIPPSSVADAAVADGTRSSALIGMPEYGASAGSWTSAAPPCTAMVARPAAPSSRAPDSTTPITRLP